MRIGTIFFGDTELGVRWPAAILACTTGFTLFYLARHWFSARAAFWTVVLFAVVPMYAWKMSFMTEATASIGLMALALLGLSRATEDDRLAWWLLAGLACGLAMLVSIANAWWLGGLLLYFVIDPARRAGLREPRLWMLLVVAGVCLAPLLWWWHGAQVADIRRARLVSDFPLNHPFSFTQGLHFLALELIFLSPLFALALGTVLVRMRHDLRLDSRYALLVCLALPGLLWENFAAFFSETNFELVPALFLPLLLLGGCCADRLTAAESSRRMAWGAVMLLAALESLAGFRSFYLSPGGDHPATRAMGEQVLAGLGAPTERASWHNLADQMVQMQRDTGANLIITDSPATASELSFYMPRHPSIYVEDVDTVTQFDFWPQYTDAASPNDSALFFTRSRKEPSDELKKNFTTIEPLPYMPTPEFEKAWNIWNCEKFVGTSQPAGVGASPMHETDPLPK